MLKYNMFRVYYTAAVEYNAQAVMLKYNMFRVYCTSAVEYNALCSSN